MRVGACSICNKIVVQDHVQDQQWSEDLLFRRNCRFSRIILVVLSGPGRGGRRIGKTQFAARVRVSVWVFPKPGSRFAGPQPITLAELCGLFSYNGKSVLLAIRRGPHFVSFSGLCSLSGPRGAGPRLGGPADGTSLIRDPSRHSTTIANFSRPSTHPPTHPLF